jgi:hypothetical protein
MPEANTPDVVEREVGATPGEFLRGLHLAFPGGVSEDGGRIRAVFGPAAMEIVLTPLESRVIALMTLPRLKVSLRGTAGSDAEQAALLARMDLAMQRGGG